MPTPLPPQDRLLSLFYYLPETGVLVNKRLNKRVGTVIIGSNSTRARRQTRVDGKTYYVARLIWMLVYGEDPGDKIVDHINRDALDDRLENLRLASRSENRKNSKLNKNSSTGYRGVYPNGKGFIARITVNGKLQGLGTFRTREEAAEAIANHRKA